jgi:thiamine transport system substrate-binding protein
LTLRKGDDFMQKSAFSIQRQVRSQALALKFRGSLGLLAALLGAACVAQAKPVELRVLTHSSFSVPKPLLAQFEKDHGVVLRINKAGDAGEMLNKLILTKANPIADVVYGIDNALAPKALAADVLTSAPAPASSAAVAPQLANAFKAHLLPVDYGYVTLNYDKAWVAQQQQPLPQTLEQLTQPAYAKWLVVQNPATSSPGYAFLLATIGAMGEEKAFDWWGRMRANGLKVSKGWTEAYYTDFSRNGGKYPLVVSYASSPAAEMFYAKDKPATPPTVSLSIPGAVFRQVEGIALVKGGRQQEAALQFMEFMRSAAVQTQMQTQMWMLPGVAGIARAKEMQWAPDPTGFTSPSEQDIAAKGAQWVARWTAVVLK